MIGLGSVACTLDPYNSGDPANEEFFRAQLLECIANPSSCSTGGSDSGSGGGSGSAAAVIRIYTDSTLRDGALGNRAATSVTCQSIQTTNYAGFSCTNHLAILSYNADDMAGAQATYSIPSAIAVTSHTNTVVATNWPSYVSSALQSTLVAAGVTAVTPYYWTGSNGGGVVDTGFNCAEWGGTGGSGKKGRTDSNANATAHWFFAQEACTTTAPLMCICW